MPNFLSSAHLARALLLAAGLSAVTPALAQNAAFDAAANQMAMAPLQNALKNQLVALDLRADALDGKWRRFRKGSSSELEALIRSENESPNEDETEDEFVTRGEILKVGDQTYLVAYRQETASQLLPGVSAAFDSEFVAADAADLTKTKDKFTRLGQSEKLLLCLLNTRSMGDLNDVRAFDPAKDVMSDAQAAQIEASRVNQQSVFKLKKISLALGEYVQDYDETFPPMRSAKSMAQIKQPIKGNALATVQQILQPYIKSTEVFAHPITQQIYRPNLNLSGRNLASLEDSARTVAFYEAAPAADGRRAVAYADGHVTRELETDWARIRAVSDRLVPPITFKKRVSMSDSGATTVTLHGASAVAYMVRRKRDGAGHALSEPMYLSKSTGRVYYRHPETKQAIWLDAPARGITIPANQADKLREFKGFNGQKTGRDFGVQDWMEVNTN